MLLHGDGPRMKEGCVFFLVFYFVFGFCYLFFIADSYGQFDVFCDQSLVHFCTRCGTLPPGCVFVSWCNFVLHIWG